MGSSTEQSEPLMEITGADIEAGLRSLGLAGKAVEVHSSLRSFGYVGGGARTVVDALLAAECTLLVPTFSDAYFAQPLPHQRPSRNAWSYERPREWPGADRTYTAASDEVDRDMGIIPATVLHTPGRVRGNHPIMSFASLGPVAHALVDPQSPQDAYAPLEALTRHGGWILMMGVGLTEMTFLHYAEKVAGRTPFIRWANGPDGSPKMVQYGGCSNGFEAFTPLLASLERRTLVGKSVWRAFPAAETLEAAAEAIRRDPEITACAERCGRCADAIAGGPLLQ
jgi:aminoglycoside N3'-acetyltransferase